MATTSRLLVTIVTICKNAGDWNLLNDQVLLLSKKHGQLKQATTRMIQTVMTFIDQTPNMDVKLSVIETLRTVTEGKVGSVSILMVDWLLTRRTDIRRSRESPCYPYSIQHQEVPRRP